LAELLGHQLLHRPLIYSPPPASPPPRPTGGYAPHHPSLTLPAGRPPPRHRRPARPEKLAASGLLSPSVEVAPRSIAARPKIQRGGGCRLRRGGAAASEGSWRGREEQSRAEGMSSGDGRRGGRGMDWMAGAARRGGAAGTGGAEGIGRRGRAEERARTGAEARGLDDGDGQRSGRAGRGGEGKSSGSSARGAFRFSVQTRDSQAFHRWKKRPRLGELVAFGASWRSKSC
jgi:hypothetical protein